MSLAFEQLSELLPKLAGIEQRAAQVLTERFALPAVVVEPVEYLLLRPGKGLRPAMAFAIAEAYGSQLNQGVDAVAIAAELIHVGSLLHDDIVDGASMRRAAPTAHLRFDANTAVLAGDVLVGAALRLIAEDCQAASLQAAGRAFYALASAQALETRLRGQVVSLAQARAIAQGKTGALFAWIAYAAACEAGQPAQAQAWWQWGEALGVVFQINDDLNDRRGQSQGKDNGLDAAHQIPSLLDTGLERDCDRSLQAEVQHWQSILVAPPVRGPVIDLAIAALS